MDRLGFFRDLFLGISDYLETFGFLRSIFDYFIDF